MTPTQSSQNYIQQALESLNQKFDNFIASLPQTYVTIRAHDIQIKAHDQAIADNAKRLDALEAWNAAVGKWSLEQHDNMRKESLDQHDGIRKDFSGEVKDINRKFDSVETSVISVEKSLIKMTEQQSHQTNILKWVLGIFTTLTVGGIGVVVAAFLTHLIHF